MDLISILNTIALGLSLILSFSLGLASNKKSGTTSLAILTTIIACIIALRLSLYWKSILSIIFPFLIFPMFLLIGPLVLYYTRSALLGISLRAQLRSELWVPGTAILIIPLYGISLIVFPELRDPEQIHAMPDSIKIPVLGTFSFFLLWNVGHAIRSLVFIRSLINNYEKEQSSYIQDRMRWIKLFNWLFACILLLALILLISAQFFKYEHLHYPVTPFETAFLLIIFFFLAHQMFERPQLFRNLSSMQGTEPEAGSESYPQQNKTGIEILDRSEKNPESKKYARQQIAPEDQQRYINDLEHLLISEQPYLQEDLSLGDLATMMDLSSHVLSMVINLNTGSNFYRLINGCRVHHAAELMRNPEYASLTLIEIAFQSGFNSKSAFNRIFKDQTGHTPGNFRSNPQLKPLTIPALLKTDSLV